MLRTLIRLCTPIALCALIVMPTAEANTKLHRFGVGFSNQLAIDAAALSIKMQRTRSFAFGAVAAFDSSTTGGFGAGVKVYRILFEEPQLTFYASALGALLSKKSSTTASTSGFQFDFTVGSEFSLAGLDSIGISFETGLSVVELTEVSLKTTGNNFIQAGIHFYL